MSELGAAFYRDRAAEMRKLADEAQTEALGKSFLQLEASWLRLAEEAEKSASHDPAAKADDSPSS
jgi:hypothetical protein